MPTSTTRVQILRDICELIEGAGDIDVLRSTTAEGSTTSAVDGTLADADGDTSALGRPFLRIDELVTSGPASGEVSRVRKAGFTVATGALALSPALSATVKASTDFSLWRWIHPNLALRLLQETLRELRRQTFVPVTVLDSRLATDGDGDMEASGTGSWSGTTATLSKSTTAANVRHGAQSLRVQANAGTPAVQSQSVPAVEGQQWLCGAAVKVTTGSVGLQPYDVTASADIGDAVTSDEAAYQWAGPDLFEVPADCKQIALRLEGSTASDDWYADDVVLWPTLGAEYELPSWIEDPKDLIAVGYFRDLRAYNTDQVYTPGEGEFVPWDWQPGIEMIEEGGSHPFRIYLRTPVTQPLYMLAWRPCGALAADTDTTTVNRALLVQLTAQKVFLHLARQAKDAEEKGGWLLDAQLAGKAAEGYLAGYRFSRPERRVRMPRFVGYAGSGQV